jgi:type IV pilus assembly protein PilY1
MIHRRTVCALSLALAWLPGASRAQTTYTENFTGSATNNSWYFFNGACLTAGNSTATQSPGVVPACTTGGSPGTPAVPGSPGTPSAYYVNKGDATLVGGNAGVLPDDPTVGGALRFTNGAINATGSVGGFNENGAIVSNFVFPTSNGIQVTFVTESYRGNSAGSSVADGADGMSFFLQSTDNPLFTPDLGAFGGSLGYSCSNTNYDGTLRASGQPRGFDGLIGGYIAVGIDEFGNFWNAGDNTATGPSYQGNRIAMRGAGSTTWTYLNAAYPGQYPATLTSAQRASAVQQACKNGYVYDWSGVGIWNNNGNLVNGAAAAAPVPTTPYNSTPLSDYAIIPNAAKLLGANIKIANESALYRGPCITGCTGSAGQFGVPITYNLTITPAGLLSLAYSYNGGTYQPVITGQDITAANGALPNNVRFGFAGSTGGGTNIHEIMCFQAQPASQSSVSAGINQKQSAKVQVGSQVYFAYYNSNNWPGSLTSQNLIASPTDPNTLIISPTANWDASCVLTGVQSDQTCAATGVAGPSSAQGPGSRTLLSSNGVTGIPFEWSNLTSAEQTVLDTGDSTATSLRLNYLRGDRTNELNAHGVGLYRARTSVLGDIIDSSPTWVGPPAAGYGNSWTDLLPGAGDVAAPAPPENASSAQTYAQFVAAEKTRTNVVYAGSNDGLLHGFRAGSFDASGNYVGTYNDGTEVLGYMPAHVINKINSSTSTANDFSNPQYGHQFYVDATPGTGDLFYGGSWHTWLIGGLGAGGAAIYALDITDPVNFTEVSSGAQATLIGEWSSTTVSGVTSVMTCINTASPCSANLGNTYGTPQIKRFHNGMWGFIIGNGFGSSSGDAGIYVVTVNSSSGALTWYYLSTGVGGGNGIAYPAAADIDGDHITDYVYAGDLLGHLWRFDLTSADPAQWAVTAGGPLFTTLSGQPITTKPIIVLNNSSAVPRLLIEFGTGRQTPFTNVSAATYAGGTYPFQAQALYGIWDWNMTAWNASSGTQFASLAANSPGTTSSMLQQQSITGSYNAALTGGGSSYRTVSNYAVCYADLTGCTQRGWYLDLPVGPADPANSNSPTVAEQVLFAPALLSGVFVVNTTVPPTNSPTTCSSTTAAAWTMALDPATGGALSSSYFQYVNGHYINVTTTSAGSEQGVSGIANLGTGTPTEVIYQNQAYQVDSPVTGGANVAPPPPGVCLAGESSCPVKHHFINVSGKRITWVERR